MTLEEAKQYIRYSDKEGYAVPDDYETMTDAEIIAWAEEAGARGDAMAEDQEEE